MNFFDRKRDAASWSTLIPVFVLLALFAGCKEEWRFGHEVHLENDVSCGDCHGARGGKMAVPGLEGCFECHEEELRAEPRLATYVEKKELFGAKLDCLGDEVLFSHEPHKEAGLECAACHGGILEDRKQCRDVIPAMDRCVGCHREQGAATDCATCHKKIRKDRAPLSHEKGWKAHHGDQVQVWGMDGEGRCDLCHKQRDCDACHRSEPPRDHTNTWRERSHGLLMPLERERCETCHRADFCVRCHKETSPRSHRAGWDDPRNRHCMSCHFPLSSNTCSVCHPSTPGHLAVGLPADANHKPGADCRHCHQIIKHADKGDPCIACHR